jgi:hypothetical protein
MATTQVKPKETTDDILKEIGSNIGEAAKDDIKPVLRAKPKTIKIILEANENIPPTGQFFGINGVSFILRAGEPAVVPWGIKEILDNAVENTPVRDGSNRLVSTRKKLRYPYTIVRDDEVYSD